MNKNVNIILEFRLTKVNNVRGDFDKIVNKESEFQNVMYNFTSRAPMTWQVKSSGKRPD